MACYRTRSAIRCLPSPDRFSYNEIHRLHRCTVPHTDICFKLCRYRFVSEALCIPHAPKTARTAPIVATLAMRRRCTRRFMTFGALYGACVRNSFRGRISRYGPLLRLPIALNEQLSGRPGNDRRSLNYSIYELRSDVRSFMFHCRSGPIYADPRIHDMTRF